MKQTLLLSLLAISLFAGCKKDKDETALSLKGKWNVENTVIKEYDNGILIGTDTEPGSGSTIDFQNNGTAVIVYPGIGSENLSYIIKPDSKVEIDGDVFEIRGLTNSNVTLFLKENYAPGEYGEVYINLNR